MRYTACTTLVLDLDRRQLIPEAKAPAKLRLKAFCFACYLALRRTDGTDGWVDLAEITERVPKWRELTAAQAGKHIQLFNDRYRWFGEVQWEEITRGPYRLRPDVEFRPNRDEFNLFLAFMPERNRSRQRRLTDTELQAYHLLAQYGVYAPPIVDLILQRLGNVDRLANTEERLIGYRILVTLAKNRGQTAKARTLAMKALPLAHSLHRVDDIAYLLDQLGCIHHIDGQAEKARDYFEQEITFLKDSEAPRARFHLVGAYRGLGMALHAMGKKKAALAAIRHSRECAEQSRNEQGLHLAHLVESSINGGRREPSAVEVLRQLPAGHPIAYVMLLNTLAEQLLSGGKRAAGEELLRLAFRDASAFSIKHAAECSRSIARHFQIEIEAERPKDSSSRARK